MENNDKTVRMPKELLENFLHQLRSGKVKQGQDYLFNDKTGGYCCLGVLQACATGGKIELASGVERRHNTYASLPSKKWLAENGITFRDDGVDETNDPWLPSLNKLASEANDYGVSFEQIAEAFERHTETY